MCITLIINVWNNWKLSLLLDVKFLSYLLGFYVIDKMVHTFEEKEKWYMNYTKFWKEIKVYVYPPWNSTLLIHFLLFTSYEKNSYFLSHVHPTGLVSKCLCNSNSRSWSRIWTVTPIQYFFNCLYDVLFRNDNLMHAIWNVLFVYSHLFTLYFSKCLRDLQVILIFLINRVIFTQQFFASEIFLIYESWTLFPTECKWSLQCCRCPGLFLWLSG